MLRIQYEDGDTTDFTFSDFIHWSRVLAEKKIWARKPMAYIRNGSLIRIGFCY